MATNFNKSDNTFQHVSVPFNYRRGNPMPLDDDAVWLSFDAAQEYARTSPIAYVGQVLNVIEDGDGKCYMIINDAGDLKDIGGESTQLLVNVEYAELVRLINNNELVPGCQYRITDYVATTDKDSLYAATRKTAVRRQLMRIAADTTPDGPAEFDIGAVVYRSANKQFDIIVTADDDHTLNETARCIKHVYEDNSIDVFEGCILEAWQIKYCVWNDITRFAWADDSQRGKGVIYWMKDEYGNEAPYDFKGILFGSYSPNENLYEGMSFPDYYTFSFINSGYSDYDDPSTYFEEVYDDTGKFIQGFTDDIGLRPQRNKIAPYIANGKQYLNGIVFTHWSPSERGPCGNEFKENCAACMFYTAEGCDNNKFGIGCALILISYPINFEDVALQYHGAVSNEFEDYCSDIIIDYTCWDIIVRKYSYAIKIGYECRNIDIGEGTTDVTILPCCNNIKVGISSYTISVGRSSSNISIGADNKVITIGDSSSYITMRDNNENITIGENCSYIDIDRLSRSVQIGNQSTTIKIGYNAAITNIAEDCANITIGNQCYFIDIPTLNTNIKLGNMCQSITLSENNSTIIIEDGCEGITLLKPKFNSVVVQQRNIGISLDTNAPDNLYTKNIEVQQGCHQDGANPITLTVNDPAGNQSYKTTFANAASIVNVVA